MVLPRQMSLFGGKHPTSATISCSDRAIIKDELADLRDFRSLISAISQLLKKDESNKIKMKIINYLVHRINIIPDGFEVHFKVSESYVKILTAKLAGVWDDVSDKKMR